MTSRSKKLFSARDLEEKEAEELRETLSAISKFLDDLKKPMADLISVILDDLKEKLLELYNEELDGLISALSSTAEVAGLLKPPRPQRGLDLLTRDVRPVVS